MSATATATPAHLTGSRWGLEAACRREDPSYFFSPRATESKHDRQVREMVARVLCRACPVQPQCLEHALESQEPHGVWGGLNEPERRHLLRQRAASSP